MWRFVTVTPRAEKTAAAGAPRPTAEQSADVEVDKELQITGQESSKRKRGVYNTYTAEFRAKVARYALENGDARAVRHFSNSTEVKRPLNESVVRNWRQKWLSARDASPNPSSAGPSTIETKSRGRPLLLGQLDDKVKDYITNIRRAGGIVNRGIVIAAARGVVKHHDRTRLVEYGGSLDLTRTWAESFLSRLGYVKRKGTRAARKIPDNFDAVQVEFLSKIENCVSQYDIPDVLIINFDQTGINIVPTGKYTQDIEGSKQVEITGIDDKRQVTALLSVDLAGNFLPPHVIYKGKTEQCHPNYNFPPDWDIYHSENHWSNAHTMDHFLDNLLLPHIHKVRQDIGRPNQQALCIFDVFAAHRTNDFIDKLHENGVSTIFVPANCTPLLQPLDCEGSINDEFKKEVKNGFTSWYSELISDAMDEGKALSDIKIDLRMSVLKPLHAKWMVEAFDRTKVKLDVVKRGWRKTGIEAAVQRGRNGGPQTADDPHPQADDDTSTSDAETQGTRDISPARPRNIFERMSMGLNIIPISSDSDDDVTVA